MLERFRQFWTDFWAPVAHGLLKIGVKPDHVTIVGTLGVAVGALWFLPRGQFLLGGLVITAFIFSDLIDGLLARLTGTSSRWGAFLDSTLDRVGDAAIFGGLVLWYAGDGDSTLYLSLALACLVLGSLTSYTRARAESLGMRAKGGVAERADRLAVILVATTFAGLLGWPVLIEIALWVLIVGSTATVLQRVLNVRHQAVAGDTDAGGP